MPGVTIRRQPLSTRFSLRCPPESASAVDKLLGFPLPREVGATALDGATLALCLGPDEWWLLAPPECSEIVAAAFRQSANRPGWSLVDIGHRDLTIEVIGPLALRVLAGACPLDLARMAVGRATRTLFGASEVVIFRREIAAFELTAARSYTPYVEALLAQISREVHLVG